MKNMQLDEILGDLRHDLKSPLVGMKALIFTAKKKLEKNEPKGVAEALSGLDQRVDVLVGEVDKYTRRVEEVLRETDKS